MLINRERGKKTLNYSEFYLCKTIIIPLLWVTFTNKIL